MSITGFKLQSILLARLIQLVEDGRVQQPLFDAAIVSNSNMTNSLFMREYCINLLRSAFPHLQP